MKSIIPKHRPSIEDIVKIEKPGKFEDKTKKDYQKDLKYKELLEGANEAKSFDGWIRGRIKIAKFENNLDVATLLEMIRLKNLEYQKKGYVRLNSWKGKSSLQLIKSPESIICVTFQKPNKDEEPKEVKTVITKDEINYVIQALKCWKIGEKADTKEVAEMYCRIAEIWQDDLKNNIFENTKFQWRVFFAWRWMHLRFNLILRILDKEGMIKYRGRKSELLNREITIQEVLT